MIYQGTRVFLLSLVFLCEKAFTFVKHNTKYAAQNYGVFTMTVNDTDKIQFHASHFLSLSASVSRVEQRKNTNRLFYENASKHDMLSFHDTLRSSNKTKDFRCSNTCFLAKLFPQLCSCNWNGNCALVNDKKVII